MLLNHAVTNQASFLEALIYGLVGYRLYRYCIGNKYKNIADIPKTFFFEENKSMVRIIVLYAYGLLNIKPTTVLCMSPY